MTIELQRSVSSSSGSTASALPANYKPLYDDRERLDGIIRELTVVAKLGENERLSQVWIKDAKTAKERPIADYVYPDPAKSALLWTQGTRMGQAEDRRRNKDSTFSACERIRGICSELIYSIEKLNGASRFSFLSGSVRMVEKYDAIQKLMSEIVEKTHANLRRTVELDQVNVSVSTESQKESKLQQIDVAIGEVRGTILPLIEEIGRLVEARKGGARSVDEVIGMVLNPVAQFAAEEVGIPPSGPLLAKDVIEKLAFTYGHNAVNDVVALYKLEKNVIFDMEDLHALLIGITSNLTYDDICVILRSKQGALYEKLQSKFGERLAEFASDGVVRNEELLFDILCAARDIDLGDRKLYREKPYAKQYDGDLSSILSCQLVEEYNFKESQFGEDSYVHKLKQKFGYAEHLTRDHCYSRFTSKEYKFRPGVLSPHYNKEGEKVCREISPIFAKDAIFAMGVCPVAALSKEEKEVEIVFRGTYDLDSVLRDFSLWEKRWTEIWEGPGGNSFLENEEAIAGAVQQFLAQKAFPNGKVVVLGHSLGATDVSRAGVLLARMAANLSEQDSYKGIKEWEFVCFNGTAIEGDQCKSFIDSVAALEDSGVTFNVNLLTTEGDVVHEFGTYYIGHRPEGVEKPKNLSINLVRFHFTDGRTETGSLQITSESGSVDAAKDSGYKKYLAHSSSWFKESIGRNVNVHRYCSDDDAFEELVHEEDRGQKVPKEEMHKLLTPYRR